MSNRPPIVVVGGGTAGCTVVSQLASSTAEEIVLIEPGVLSGGDDDSLFMNLLASSHVDNAAMVSLVDGGELVPYTQARSLGGSSAINAMLLTGDAPESLSALTRLADVDDMGQVSKALLACGGRASRLWWNGGRWNPGRAVQHLVDEGRVRHVREKITNLVYGNGGISAVATENLTLESQTVVMCTGALSTPALLLPMKLGKLNRDVGLGLQNHPTITFTLRLRHQSLSAFDSSVVAEHVTSSGAKLLAVAYERASMTDASHGLLTVSLMNPVSRGAVWMSEEGVQYDFNMLANEFDRAAMRDGIRWLLELVSQPAFVAIADGVFVDSEGGNAILIDGMKNQDLDTWIRENLTLVSHASSSCSQAIDAEGKLRGLSNVYIADASALSGVPSETPAASVTIEATRISRLLAEELK
jgi:choline dehydrogenase-like flavoprotein